MNKIWHEEGNMVADELILIVDDEEGLARMLQDLLLKEGWQKVKTAATGEAALELVQMENVDLILLDVMLPDCSGFDLCKELRRLTQAPILFLTARSGDYEKLAGLAIGGDDYITKPFNPLEVAARVQAHLRRQRLYREEKDGGGQLTKRGESIKFGPFRLYKEEGCLEQEGSMIPLTAKEFELLCFLVEHPNRVFTVQQLYERVWGPYYEGDDKTVVIHISRLRKKLGEDPKEPVYLINLRGIGYKFVPVPQGART